MASRLEESKIAARYAKALFDGALETKVLDKVYKDLCALRDLFHAVPGITGFLTNPAIPQTERTSFIQEQFEKKVQPLVYNLIKLMEENDRITALPSTIDRFEEILNERNRVATAEVVTAVELSEKLESKLCKTLESMFGLSEVNLHKRVDPGILGGAIVKIQDKVIDGSYVGKLEALRKQVG